MSSPVTSRPHTTRQTSRHLLHVFASFGLGGVPIRICEVINGLEDSYRHTVVALDACFDANRRLAPDRKVEFRSVPLPAYNLLRSLWQFRGLINDVRPDVLLTYNWGAIECAMANRIFGFCKHIHLESGFGLEEGDGQIGRRSLFRRVALGRTSKVVVPSFSLVEIAEQAWRIPPSKLVHIPNGVDLAYYAATPGTRSPGIWEEGPDGRCQGAAVIGTVAPLRAEKNVGRLLRAFEPVAGEHNCILVVAGDGPERPGLEALASSLGIAERTYFLGHLDDVPGLLRSIDIFALSSNTEQMPNSLLQAMAAGRPVASVAVGDVARMVAPKNRDLIVPRDDEAALSRVLADLVSDPQRRQALGGANQAWAKANYALDRMVGAYSDLLGGF